MLERAKGNEQPEPQGDEGQGSPEFTILRRLGLAPQQHGCREGDCEHVRGSAIPNGTADEEIEVSQSAEPLPLTLPAAPDMSALPQSDVPPAEA